jgi:tight adherence protein C
MGGDAIGGLMTLLTFLLVLGGSFFLAYGLWEILLKPLFSEAKELEDRSTLKAMRRVILRKMATYNRRIVWPRYEKRISRKVMNAGGLSGLTPEEFLSMQQLSCFGFTVFGLILINFLRKTVGLDASYLYTVLFSIGGFFFPESWLRDQVKKRHFKITRELPYNMDLLTLSVEAGLDFQAAVGTVCQKGKQGPLVEEFDLMLKHLRVGKTRQEALRMMADRVGLPQLSSFIAALIQADRMGTSLGKVLRIQSTQMRIERTQRAEKLANEAPVKMLFPLIACIFPTVFMVLFGPIVFQFMTGEF